jgi:rhodanese-related sulfurtransferase
MKLCAVLLALILSTGLVLVRAAEIASKLDLDSVHVGETARRDLLIPNSTGKPITIKEVSASCSCVHILGVSRTITPNATGNLTLEYKPTRPGKAEIEILVALDPANAPVVEFHWTGEVLPMITPAQPKAASTAAESASFIATGELARTLVASHGMLVDIREPARYHLGSIDGAANWPVSILRTFSSLRAKPIVLAGNGSDDATVLQAALELRQAGFQSVKVLRGGIRRWMMVNSVGDRSPMAAMSSALVSPIEFLSSAQDEWLVVRIHGVASTASKVSEIPEAVTYSLGPAFAATLSEEVRKAAVARPLVSKILVASEDGSSYEIVEGSLPKDLPLPLFYLKGGALAYWDAVAQGIALRSQRTAKVSTTGFVRGYPEAKVFRSGCATCPK